MALGAWETALRVATTASRTNATTDFHYFVFGKVLPLVGLAPPSTPATAAFPKPATTDISVPLF